MSRANGRVMSVAFQLEGQKFLALNGGPVYKFNESISLFVGCETQAEIDDHWAKLTAAGGSEGQCGWLKDKFGLSWQVVPNALPKLLGGGTPEQSKRVLDAMLQMSKLDLARLQAAFDGVA